MQQQGGGQEGDAETAANVSLQSPEAAAGTEGTETKGKKKRTVAYVTGFGTFHGCKVNPTEKIVGELRKSVGEGARAEISTVALAGASVLHVSAVGCERELATLREKLGDTVDIWLHLGVHGSATEFHIEQIAYNLDDFRCPDENGEVRKKSRISETAPDMLFARLGAHGSTETIQSLLQRQGFSCKVSNDAGRFICNHTFFDQLHHFSEEKEKAAVVLFLHVPNESVVAIEEQTRCVRALLEILSSFCDTS